MIQPFRLAESRRPIMQHYRSLCHSGGRCGFGRFEVLRRTCNKCGGEIGIKNSNVFRRRFSVQQSIEFASALPAVLSAFFSDWDIETPLRPFEEREVMINEVLSVRRAHNLAPRSVIADIASAVLVRLLPDWKMAGIERHALFPSGQAAKPAARAFADYLQQSLKTF